MPEVFDPFVDVDEPKDEPVVDPKRQAAEQEQAAKLRTLEIENETLKAELQAGRSGSPPPAAPLPEQTPFQRGERGWTPDMDAEYARRISTSNSQQDIDALIAEVNTLRDPQPVRLEPGTQAWAAQVKHNVAGKYTGMEPSPAQLEQHFKDDLNTAESSGEVMAVMRKWKIPVMEDY